MLNLQCDEYEGGMYSPMSNLNCVVYVLCRIYSGMNQPVLYMNVLYQPV